MLYQMRETRPGAELPRKLDKACIDFGTNCIGMKGDER
jgi:hypothetical protein